MELIVTAHDMDFERRRLAMVEQLRGELRDERVLSALAQVPRHLFVAPDLVDEAYDDKPLPIGEGQTCSQPLVVGLMCEAARVAGAGRVLEVGTGCGYAAAVMARLCVELHTIERIPSLAHEAKVRLASLAPEVQVHLGDGTRGLPEAAPFDAVLVAAAAAAIPEPLLRQLADGGRLVIPVGPSSGQRLTRVTRAGEQLVEEALTDVRFVPLISH